MTDPGRVLLVDDEAEVRAALAQAFELADLKVEEAASAAAAMKALRRAPPGAVVTDLRMPGEDGFAVLAAAHAADPEIPVVILTGHGDVPLAVRAVGQGAYDFIEKPASPARLTEVLRRALDRRRLVLENRALRRRVQRPEGLPLTGRRERLTIGEAPASRAFRDRLEAVAAAEADALIVGETGTGKEGAARAIHALSARARGPFVTVNCGGLDPDTASAELFGYETGAFSGARAGRPGRFEEAEGGVVFLDEVESMPAALQPGLLRVLAEREVRRLGAPRPVRLDIRVIAAAKADLREEVAAGRFREDLFYRLDVARLRVPPLRERLSDAPLLFSIFVERAGGGDAAATPEVSARLMAHDWPGNVRELKNAAERFACGLGLAIGEDEGETPPATLAARMEAFERRVIEEALAAASGRVAAAAEALGLPRKTLYDKLARHGLAGADFRRREAAGD
ncbi:MAG: sigma-54 dependent transcriptional regulator [Pseudomonadota bacterium]